MSRRAASNIPVNQVIERVQNEGHRRASSSIGSNTTLSASMSSSVPANTFSKQNYASTGELNASKRVQALTAAPGGVLATHKWNVLEEGKVNVDLACRAWPGKMELSDNGQRRFVIEYSSFPKPEIKRQEVIHELITTEQEYVRDLRIIIDVFMHNMKTMNLAKEEGLNTIFSNIDILAKANEEFLAALLERKARDLGLPQEIGDIFCKMADRFRVYNTYCSNQNAAMEFLQQCKNTELGIFIQFCAMKPEARGLDLSFFLIKPVQRICKYPLLLRELAKNTNPTHADHKLLGKAIEIISDVVDFVNEKKRQAEQREHMLATLAKIEFTDTMSLPTNPDRYIVYEGTLYKSSKSSMKKVMSHQRWAILFNDCLVVSKSGMFSNSKYQVNAVFSIWSIGVGNIEDTDKIKNAFEIKIDEKRSFVYSVPTAEEKKKWLNMFAQAIEKATRVLQTNNPDKMKSAAKSSKTSLLESVSGNGMTDSKSKLSLTEIKKNEMDPSVRKSGSLTNLHNRSKDDQIVTKVVKTASEVSLNVWRVDEQCNDDDATDEPTLIKKSVENISFSSETSNPQLNFVKSTSANDLQYSASRNSLPDDERKHASTAERKGNHEKSYTSPDIEQAKAVVIAGKLAGPITIALVKETKPIEEKTGFPKTQVTIANVESVRSKFLKNNNLPKVPGPAPTKPPASYKTFHKPATENVPTVPQSPGKIFTAVNAPVEMLSPTASSGIRNRIAALVSQSTYNPPEKSTPPSSSSRNPSLSNVLEPPKSSSARSSITGAPTDSIRSKIQSLIGNSSNSSQSKTETYEISSDTLKPSAVKRTGLYSHFMSGSQPALSDTTPKSAVSHVREVSGSKLADSKQGTNRGSAFKLVR